MRKSILNKAVAFAAAGLFSTALMAGDAQHTSTFEALDKNSDQQISKSEAQSDSKLSDSFASADTNGDGYLSKSEYRTKMDSAGKSSGSQPAERPTS